MSTPNVIIKAEFHKYFSKPPINNEILMKRYQERQYYSSNQEDGNDYVKYMDTGSKSGKTYDYIKYAGNEEKSSGIFGINGLYSDSEKKELRKIIRTTKSNIYSMVISFEEYFGKDKIKAWPDAQAILVNELPRFLKETGINYDNVTWFGALHENTDNRHIHLVFFEKEPLSKRANKPGLFYHQGKLMQFAINNLKVRIEEHMDDHNYFFDSRRRNLLLETQNSLSNISLDQTLEQSLRLNLLDLYRQMPSKNTGFNNKSMEHLRPLILEIENILIEKNPKLKEEFRLLRFELEQRDKKMKLICESHKLSPDRFMLMNKYLEDFHRRIGNAIIKYTKKYVKVDEYEEWSFKKKRLVEKNSRRKLFKETSYLANTVDLEAKRTFDEYENKLRKAEIELLIEEGVLDPNEVY